jgi:hypothetical protein
MGRGRRVAAGGWKGWDGAVPGGAALGAAVGAVAAAVGVAALGVAVAAKAAATGAKTGGRAVDQGLVAADRGGGEDLKSAKRSSSLTCL